MYAKWREGALGSADDTDCGVRGALRRTCKDTDSASAAAQCRSGEVEDRSAGEVASDSYVPAGASVLSNTPGPRTDTSSGIDECPERPDRAETTVPPAPTTRGRCSQPTAGAALLMACMTPTTLPAWSFTGATTMKRARSRPRGTVDDTIDARPAPPFCRTEGADSLEPCVVNVRDVWLSRADGDEPATDAYCERIQGH